MMHEEVVCLTVDVEWACPEVLADTVRLLDEAGIRGTFFCTHPGIEVPGHERALHPNFRRSGDTMRRYREESRGAGTEVSDSAVYRYVVAETRAFCPEAVGVRAHSLLYDADLLPVYRAAGLEYDSSYFLPLEARLRPVWKEHDILELPIYYMDHWALVAGAGDFTLEGLRLDRPGLKVFDFHPNLVFINGDSADSYLASKAFYHDPGRLLELRRPGRGARTLLVELLEHLVGRGTRVATLAELNAATRASSHPSWAVEAAR